MSPLLRGSGGGDESSRSDEERERARAEREARRAAREGRAAQPTGDVPTVAATPTPAPDPIPEPEPAPPPPPPPARTDVFPPVTPDRLARLPGDDLAPASVAAATGLDEPEPVIPSTEPPRDPDEPVGPRPVRREGASGVLAGAAARKPRRRRRRRWVALVALLVFVGAIGWFANSLWQPFHGSGHGRVVVEIPPNSSSSQIGDILEHNGAVSSSFFFALRARLSGKSKDMRPGRYVLKEDMPYSAAIDVLSTPPTAAKVVNVSIPEGLSIREAGPLVKSAGLKGSYIDDTARSDELKPRFYGAPHNTHSLEGFLFPATYQLKPGASVKALIHKQIVAFRAISSRSTCPTRARST